MRIEDLSEAKGTKAEAGYQPNPKNGQKCINCTMWRDPNKCTAVAGNIKPEGWCKWYAGGAYGKRGKKVDESLNVLSQWKNDEPVGYVKQLVKFFKNPDELTHKRAIWYNKDGFKRIEVLDEYILHSSPVPHYDYVYSYVDLKVPHDLSDDLAKSSESILIDHLKGEVGARCASLSANAVTLQYVMDVVEGNIKPSKAEYEKRIKSMKKMFADGKRFELDWWPDITGDTDPKNPYYKESKLNNNTSVYEDSKSKKQVKENIDNWRENIGTNDIVKIEDRYFVVDSFSRSRYGSGLFFRRIDSVIYYKQIDEYQFFGPKTGFYTFNEFNKDKSIEFVMKSSDPKYQEFLLNQDRLKIKENVFFKEDGRIVKGVNTTIDVGPGEIKTQSAKFGNRVDKDGFPPFLRTDGKVTEEKYSLREWAAMQGGHTIDDEPKKRKPFDWNKY